jgi:hypothetical protein
MMRYRLATIVIVLNFFALTGCAPFPGNFPLPAGSTLATMNSQLTDLVGQLEGLKPDSPEATVRRAELAQLANDAGKAAAESAAGDPLMAVSFYRVACVAAWKAGSTSVLQLSSAGAATCARLPAHDDSAPRDCAMIKLSEPLAVYEDLLQQTNQFDAKLKGLRERAASAVLPSSDADPVARTLSDMATQYRKVSEIRAAMSDAVPSELKVQTDKDRLTIYCAAVATWVLARNVQDATNAKLEPLKEDVLKMEDNYQSTVGHFPDCRSS